MSDFLSACEQGRVTDAQRLYTSDPSVLNCRDSDGYTPLMWSLCRHHSEVYRWLVTLPGSCEGSDCDNVTALHWACEYGADMETVATIARQMDGRVNQKSSWGWTALDNAVEYNNGPAVTALARVPAVLWDSGRLQREASQSRMSPQQKLEMKKLIEKMSTERQVKKDEPHQEAENRKKKEEEEQKQFEEEKRLKEKRKLEKEKEEREQKMENEFVAMCKKGDVDEVVKCLGSYPAIVNCCNGDPLRKAVVARKLRVVEVLVKTEGLQINLRDPHGRTILHSATGTNEKEIVRKILSHPDIEVNPTSNKGLTPVMEATKNGKIESLQILLEDGRVDLDVEDEDGKTIENMLAKDLAPHLIVRANKLFQEARTRKGIQDGSIVRKKTAILVANCNYEKAKMSSLKGPKMDLEIGKRLFTAKGYKVYPIENSKDIAEDVFELIEKENLRESTEILQFVYSGHGFHEHRVQKRSSDFNSSNKEGTTETYFSQEGEAGDCLVNTDGTLCEELYLSWQIADEMKEDTTICLFYDMCRNERKDVNEKTVKEFVKTNSFRYLKGAQESGADRRTIKIFSAQLGVTSEGLNSFFKKVCEQIEESSPDGMRFEDMKTYESKDQRCKIDLGEPGLANKLWPLE